MVEKGNGSEVGLEKKSGDLSAVDVGSKVWYSMVYGLHVDDALSQCRYIKP